MHFTPVVILSPLQCIGRDYHIFLSHNGVITTNEERAVLFRLSSSLICFFLTSPVFTGSRSIIKLSLCSVESNLTGSGSGWGVVGGRGWGSNALIDGFDGKGDKGEEKQ